jgi:hypothetical protein
MGTEGFHSVLADDSALKLALVNIDTENALYSIEIRRVKAYARI